MAREDDQQSLTLGLGFSSKYLNKTPKQQQQQQPFLAIKNDHHLNEPCLTLSLLSAGQKVHEEPPPAAPCSAASSLSNTATATGVVVSVKRERESGSSEDMDHERTCNYSISRGSDEEEDGSGPTSSTRKKLRLTKDQSALLEERFKQHSTLNPKQKQALADRLNLRPRQVEVWFQNRRARTKLKQTEVDYEHIKKWCETLTDENRRLQKELHELKAIKYGSSGAQPLYMHLPAATLTMCPSCERVGTSVSVGVGVPIAAGASASKTQFIAMTAKSPFYTSFTNPSAAC